MRAHVQAPKVSELTSYELMNVGIYPRGENCEACTAQTVRGQAPNLKEVAPYKTPERE